MSKEKTVSVIGQNYISTGDFSILNMAEARYFYHGISSFEFI